MFIRRSGGNGGATLAEFLFALAIGAVVIGSTAALWMYSSRSFAGIFSYADLDNASHRALDKISFQIRQTQSLKEINSNELKFVDYDGKELKFTHSSGKRTLSRTKDGVTEVLLTECDECQFFIFQRNPIGGSYDQYPAATKDTCKLVQVKWKCSRTLFGGRDSTRNFISAKIVIRRA